MLAVAMDLQRVSGLVWPTFTLQNCHINTATILKYILLPSPTLLHHLLSPIYSWIKQIFTDILVNQVPASQVPNRQGLQTVHL